MSQENVPEKNASEPGESGEPGQRGRLAEQQAAVRKRAETLAKKVEEKAMSMPGDSGKKLMETLQKAMAEMKDAEQSLEKGQSKSAGQSARSAAQRLAEAGRQARSDARMGKQWAERGNNRSEPVRIPKADEHRAPTEFREELLEAMKKDSAPGGFGDLVKRYYEELIK
jgi:hypothetical protein